VGPQTLALPAPWVEYLSAEGWPYYFNEATGQSTWERADVFSSQSAPVVDVDVGDAETDSLAASETASNASQFGGFPAGEGGSSERSQHSGSSRKKNLQGQHPLHIVAESCLEEGLEILLRAARSASEVDALDGHGLTALQIVCRQPFRRQQVECAKRLIDYGANVHVRDTRGNSLVHSAVEHGNVELVQYLLVQGVDPEQVNRQGDSAVHVAARLANLQCMQVLVLFKNGSGGGGSARARDGPGRGAGGLEESELDGPWPWDDSEGEGRFSPPGLHASKSQPQTLSHA
jgi:hypothetical protein